MLRNYFWLNYVFHSSNKRFLQNFRIILENWIFDGNSIGVDLTKIVKILYYTDPKWKLYTLFLWITVLLVYMSLKDLRMLIETSSQITIMQFLFKSKVNSSVNAWKNVFLTLHVLRTRWFIDSFKTDKKTFAAEDW